MTTADALPDAEAALGALVDERWTSELAQAALRAEGRGGRERRSERDAAAAQIILQAWFDEAHDAP